MPAITISRQAGSHGARIARRLARELGWEFADKSTINQVIRQYGLVRLNDFYDHVPKLGELFDDHATDTIEMMNQTIAAIAARGNVVLLGRGAFHVLRGYPDVLNVFIEAPLETRIARIAARDQLDADTAAANVRHDDKLRRRFTRRYYGADWAKSDNYDLVIDTANLPDAQAVQTIIAVLGEQPGRADGSIAATEVHPVLAATIAEAIGPKPAG